MAENPTLTPPDFDRCQAEKSAGYSFMTLGGRPGTMIRCENKPTVIATENQTGDDGQIGAMSMCDECLEVFKKKMPEDYATIHRIDTIRCPHARPVGVPCPHCLGIS